MLQTDLDGAGLTLASLQAARRLPELGFTFPVRELDVVRLRALLTDPANGLAAPLRDTQRGWNSTAPRAFSKALST